MESLSFKGVICAPLQCNVKNFRLRILRGLHNYALLQMWYQSFQTGLIRQHVVSKFSNGADKTTKFSNRAYETTYIHSGKGKGIGTSNTSVVKGRGFSINGNHENIPLGRWSVSHLDGGITMHL